MKYVPVETRDMLIASVGLSIIIIGLPVTSIMTIFVGYSFPLVRMFISSNVGFGYTMAVFFSPLHQYGVQGQFLLMMA